MKALFTRAGVVSVSALALALAFQPASPSAGGAAASARALGPNMRGNPACPGEAVYYNPGRGQDIAVPAGYKVEVFAKGLNFPTGIAFRGSATNFRVFVLESGVGLPGRCNSNEAPVFGGKFSASNPFTPDLLVLDKTGRVVRGPIGKPTRSGAGFQPDGPPIGLTFENGFAGGTLFATDSNQGARGALGVGNNTSRIVTIDLRSGKVHTFISGLPTGDHPTEMLLSKDGWLYWSQGSATNSGVTGHDNGAGGNQHDIACQDVTLSRHTWSSGDGHLTSGYSNHGVTRPGATVPAFEDATHKGMCTGAILRAKIHAAKPVNTVEPFSWGYRNPFGIRFAPRSHALKGGLFVTENGEDERGARPVNNAPDRLQLAQQNPDGSPDYHGWPNRFGFLDSTQALFNPIGGPGDDNPAAVVGKPVEPVLAFFPQPPVSPLAIEPADDAVVGPDFAPAGYVHGPVQSGAALIAREGDFGFSPENGDPGQGHDIELVNFSQPGQRFTMQNERFAFNCPTADQLSGSHASCRNGGGDQAFVAHLHGINRPIMVLFGPDGALYLVDYGAVRDFGQAEPGSKFRNPTDAPLVQIPHTGTIWRISRR
jgi:glucose/arabinose dehydrogenase